MLSPNINNKVEPDIPGRTIAEIAINPATNTNIPSPKFKLPNERFMPPLVPAGLKYVISPTIRAPIKVKIIFLLSKYRSAMIYLILGLMVGSLYAVFMGPTTLEVPQPAMNLSNFSWIFFIIGGSLIIVLEKSKDFLEKKSK